jgi:hypothetical protein
MFCAVGYAGGIITTQSGTSTNVIQYLTPASEFFQLQIGKNLLSVTKEYGDFTAKVYYRNRYIGV